MSYRIEISPNNRAGCTATHCKNEGVKIMKGEMRHGVLVTINEHSSMKYRHWGCVTPVILHNWWETAEGNMELIDGFEELPDEAAEKVKRALEQGHVDDEDWNGDVECNRYVEGKKQQGMFLKKPKAKKDEEENADADEGDKSAGKKRGHPAKNEAADEEDEDEKPTAKKARATEEADETTPAKRGRGRPKKATSNAAPADEEAADKPKRGRGRPRKSDAAEPAPKDADATPKRGRGRPKKVTSTTDGAADEAGAADKPKKGRGRPKKAAPVSETEEQGEGEGEGEGDEE